MGLMTSFAGFDANGQFMISNSLPVSWAPSIGAHINDSATNAPTDCPTNSPNDARTDYGILATILGADINTINTKQNTIANNCNSIGTKVNAGFAILNILAARFNLNLDILEANGIMTP